MQRALLFAVFGSALAYELSPCQSGTRFTMNDGTIECQPCTDICQPSFACPPNTFVWEVGSNNEVWCEPCSEQYASACPQQYPSPQSCPTGTYQNGVNADGFPNCVQCTSDHPECPGYQPSTDSFTVTPPPEPSPEPSYEPMPSYEPPPEPSYEPMPSYEPPPEPSYEPMPSYEPPPESSYEPHPSFEPPPEPSHEPMPSYEPYTPRPQPSGSPTEPEESPCISYKCDENGLFQDETNTCIYFYPTQNATECLDPKDHYDPDLQQCARWYEFPSTATDCNEGYEHIIIPEEDVNVCAQFYPAVAFSCEEGQQHTYVNDEMKCKEVRPAICVNSTLPTCPEIGIYPTCEEGDTYLEDRHKCVHGILIEKDREGSAQSSSLETGSTVYTQEGEQIQCSEPYSYIIHNEQEYCVRFYEPIIHECPFGFFPVHVTDGIGFCMSVLGEMCFPNVTISTEPICPSDDPRCPPMEPSPFPHPTDPICPSDDPRCPPIELPSQTPRPSIPVTKPSESPHRIDPICPSDDPRCPSQSSRPRPSVQTSIRPRVSPDIEPTLRPSTTSTSKPRPCEDLTNPRCKKPDSILNLIPADVSMAPLPSRPPPVPPVVSLKPRPTPTPWSVPETIDLTTIEIPAYIPSRLTFPEADPVIFQKPEKVQEIQASLACTLRLPLEKIQIEMLYSVLVATGERTELPVDPKQFSMSSEGQVGCYEFNATSGARRLQQGATRIEVDYLIVDPTPEIVVLNTTEFETILRSSETLTSFANSVGSSEVSSSVTVDSYASQQTTQTSNDNKSSFPDFGSGILGAVGGCIVLVAAGLTIKQFKSRRTTQIVQSPSAQPPVNVIQIPVKQPYMMPSLRGEDRMMFNPMTTKPHHSIV